MFCCIFDQIALVNIYEKKLLNGSVRVHIHTWSELLAPLVNTTKGGCENKCALILLIFYFKKSQKSKLSLENRNLKWGEISLWNKKKILKYMLDTITGTPRNSYE